VPIGIPAPGAVPGALLAAGASRELRATNELEGML
jgi:hypothetical protein